MSDDPHDPAGQPTSVVAVVQVVKGSPTPEELAAVLAVLGAGSAGPPDEAPTPEPTGWSAYWRSVRAPLVPGPGAWRSSGRPLS